MPVAVIPDINCDSTARPWIYVLLGLSALAGLLIVSRQNYLLFHSLAEIGAVAVAWSVFLITWNARRLKTPPGFVLLGVGYMLVGGVDLLHTLAYEGMGVFPGARTDLATQLWIVARYIEAATLLLFPLCLVMANLARWGSIALITAAIAMLGSIFAWDIFPECFNPRSGLTPFKSASEYMVMSILGVATILTWRKRALIGENVLFSLTGAMLITIVSEFSFTLYASPYGPANMIGHLLKVVSFMLIYRALIAESLERPLENLAHGLRKETERYARIIETATDGFWIVDTQGRICDANEPAANMLGFSRDTLISMHVNDIEVNETHRETARRIEMISKNGYDRFETRHRHRKGSLLDVEVSCSYLPHDKGRIVAFVRDITEQKRVKTKLTAEHATLQAIFNASPDILVLKDNELVYRRVNAAFSAFVGKSDHQIIGRTDYDLFPERDAAKYIAGDAAVIQTGIRENKEWPVLGHDDRRWLQIIKTAVRAPDGQSLGVLCTGRDVSEYHRMENLLLEASQREQEKLAQELHDGLCQDLKSLEIEATLLEGKISAGKADSDSCASSIAAAANQAVKNAYAIVSGMLPVGLDAESFSTALMQWAANIQNQADCDITTSIQENLEPTDDKQAYHLYRIAQESLKNALQHSKATGIELVWRLEYGTKLLSIRDNGIGIPTEKTGPRQGMGLPVMFSRAQAIDAGLTVRNLETGGTEIRVRLKDE